MPKGFERNLEARPLPPMTDEQRVGAVNALASAGRQHRRRKDIEAQVIEVLQDLLWAYDHPTGDGKPIFTPPGDDRSDDLKCDFWSLAGRIRNTLERLGAPEVRED